MTPLQKKIIILLAAGLTVAFGFYYYRQLTEGLKPIELTGAKAEIASGAVSFLFNRTEDFEKTQAANIISTTFYSGSKAQQFNSQLEFGHTLNIRVQDFLTHGPVRKIVVAAMVNVSEIPTDASIVCSVNNSEGKNIFWSGSLLGNHPNSFELNEWKEISATFELATDTLQPQDELKIYIWNPKKKTFVVDDMSYSFYGLSHNPVVIDPVQTAVQQFNFEIDFESDLELENAQSLSGEKVRSGKRSVKLSGQTEYGAGLRKQVSSVTFDSLKSVFFSAYLMPESQDHNAVLVCNVLDAEGKSKLWLGKGTEKQPLKINEWNLFNAEFKVAECNPQPTDYVVVYLWNKSKTTVFADDYNIVFNTIKRYGADPVIDLREKQTEHFPPQNTPPFPIKSVDTLNLNKGELVFDSKFTNTNATLLSGNYYGTGNDNLLLINNSTCLIFSYCKTEHAFKKNLQLNDPALNEQYRFINFDISGRTHLMSIDKTGQIILFSFNGSTLSTCNKGVTTQKIKIEVPAGFNNKSEYLSIKSVTGQSYLLSINEREKKYQVYSLAGNSLVESATGPLHQLTEGKNILLNTIAVSGAPALVISGELPQGMATSIVTFDGRLFKTLVNRSGFNNLAQKGDAFYSLGNNQLIKMNNGFRFEALNLSITEGKINCNYRYDFNSSNKPDYYESLKYAVGNFTDENALSCIMFCSNCSDGDFKGGPCNNFENYEDLQNCIQVFEIK